MGYMEVYKSWCDNMYFDEATRDELKSIANDEKEIEDRFYKDLEFGTGGLRGVIGNGTNRMNIYTVRKATQGLANFIIKEGAADRGGLAPRFRLYLASNGVADTQYSRLESAGISHYFQEIFISEDTGFHKPEKGYFDYCFARIPDFDPAMAMIVGDSLTSDILGGRNAGLRTCWFNRTGRPPRPDIVPDFEIHRLEELPDILEQC